MWLTEFRNAYGLTLEQLGRMIRRYGARQNPPLRVSDILLERLENEPQFRTVPKLADLIAEACGATASQRDALVLKRHRGTWKPKGGDVPVLKAIRTAQKAQPDPKPKAKPMPPPLPKKRGWHSTGPRPVVQLDRQGRELARFRSGCEAAKVCGVTESHVTGRVHRRYICDEFKAFGYTFRAAEEWDAMSEADRQLDLHQMDGVKAPRGGGSHGAQMVTVISRRGHACHFDSIRAAAQSCGVNYAVFQKHLSWAQDKTPPVAELDGVRFLFTTFWDRLDDAGQAALCGGD